MVHLKRILLTGFILFSGLSFGAFLANHLIPASIVYEETTYSFMGAPDSFVEPPVVDSIIGTPDEPSMSPDPEANTVMCTMDAKMCPDGSYVGRIGPRCEFAACPDEDDPIATSEITCPQGSKEVDACIEIYAPVCASVQVECVTTPCDPIPQTFPNSCFACSEDRVDSYTEGECPVPLTVS